MHHYHRLKGKPDAHPIGAPRSDEFLVKRDSYRAPPAGLDELVKTISEKKGKRARGLALSRRFPCSVRGLSANDHATGVFLWKPLSRSASRRVLPVKP